MCDNKGVEKRDRAFLRRCAQLADLADSRVLDNPRVGAVLVYDGRIIGEGYHQRAGQAHAEVNCLASVQPTDRNLIPEATLYISLEPCYITGRTGACVDVIRRERIRTVVFAQRDTTEGAGGNSVAILRDAGVTVREYPDFVPTLAPNAHRRVFTQKGRPFVLLKWAQSSDGFLRPADRRKTYWITNPISRRLVHRWRAKTSAIIVGARTVIEDNPSLTTRLFPGPNARPVVLDLRNRCTGKEGLFQGVGELPLVFTNRSRPDIAAEVIVLDETDVVAALPKILAALHKRNYGQVTVEGGAVVLAAFIQAGLWDEARIFTGATYFGNGLLAPSLPSNSSMLTQRKIDADLLSIWARPDSTELSEVQVQGEV
ncbi:MAG: bifunctional diaminohydroxyphosphoribosylaminopyrimidine deaminase/5-amino-6-(5-phosphoribosylamino)uracil reductase RibD [Bacteroidota bacterium]